MAGQTIPTFTVIARKKSGWNIRAAQLWIPCGHWPVRKRNKIRSAINFKLFECYFRIFVTSLPGLNGFESQV